MAESIEVPRGCCHCGCGRKTKAAHCTDAQKGWVKGEPLRFVNGHNTGSQPVGEPNPGGLCMCGCGTRTPLARKSNARNGQMKGKPVRYVSGHNARQRGAAWLEVASSGCWVWQRGLTPDGYGRTGKHRRLAHRMVYEEHRGPIPGGLHLHHVCGNKACVNPDHLEPMTPEEHSRHHHGASGHIAAARAAAYRREVAAA